MRKDGNELSPLGKVAYKPFGLILGLLGGLLAGKVFGLIKTAIDRYGMKGVRRFLDAPLPPAQRRVEQARRTVQAKAS